MDTTKLTSQLIADERGDVAASYVIVVAFAILMAIAVLGFQLPIKHEATWGVSKLADNTP